MRALVMIAMLGGLLLGGKISYGVNVYLAPDPSNLACEAHLVDDEVGIKSVYVIVADGLLMSMRFAVEESPDITMTYVGETHLLAGMSGDVHSGLTICLESCALPPTNVVRIDYMSYGTSPQCGEIRIVPAPGFDGIDFIDCLGAYNFVGVWPVYVNAVYPDCGGGLCNATYLGQSSTGLNCAPVPVEESTWGSIKALYD